MLHGTQDRAVPSGHTAREAEEKRYAGALRGNTQGPERADGPWDTKTDEPQQPATEWLARDLSLIYETNQQALGILSDLFTKLTGEKSPGYPVSANSNGKDVQPPGLFRELMTSMNVLKDQSGAIVNLALTINRSI